MELAVPFFFKWNPCKILSIPCTGCIHFPKMATESIFMLSSTGGTTAVSITIATVSMILSVTVTLSVTPVFDSGDWQAVISSKDAGSIAR